MRVLIACEFSGIVRDAFLEMGHDAQSCDLDPTEVVAGRVPRIHYMSPGKTRGRDRSRSYAGIARAMAKQWG